MKKLHPSFVFRFLSLFAFVVIWTVSLAQTDKKDKQLVTDGKNRIKEFIHTDSMMKQLFKSAYGYASVGGQKFKYTSFS